MKASLFTLFLLVLAASYTEAYKRCRGGNFVIKRTPYPGNFYFAQRQCREMGGKLVSETLFRMIGEKDYKKEILAALGKEGFNGWIGITDRLHEGWWMTEEQLAYPLFPAYWVAFRWADGQPNNYRNAEHCAHITQGQLHDNDCAKASWRNHMYGVCEIPL